MESLSTPPLYRSCRRDHPPLRLLRRKKEGISGRAWNLNPQGRCKCASCSFHAPLNPQESAESHEVHGAQSLVCEQAESGNASRDVKCCLCATQESGLLAEPVHQCG